MGNRRGPGCCCGCSIADADASSDSLSKMGWVAEGGASLDVDNKVVLEPGEAIITTGKATQAGYSVRIYPVLDITGGGAPQTISGDEVVKLEGLVVEVCDTDGVALNSYEWVDLETFDLDGEEFDLTPGFWNDRKTPAIGYVFSESEFIELCFGPSYAQLYSGLVYYDGDYSRNSDFSDSEGRVHSHDQGILLSVPFEHTEDVRFRIKNDGTEDQVFERVVVTKNVALPIVELENEDGYGYGYGCPITEPEELNPTCPSCDILCSSLPGNRPHAIEVVQNDIESDLYTLYKETALENCGGDIFYDAYDGYLGTNPSEGSYSYTFDWRQNWHNGAFGVPEFDIPRIDDFEGPVTTETLGDYTWSRFAPWGLEYELVETGDCEVKYKFTLRLYNLVKDINLEGQGFDDDAFIVDRLVFGTSTFPPSTPDPAFVGGVEVFDISRNSFTAGDGHTETDNSASVRLEGDIGGIGGNNCSLVWQKWVPVFDDVSVPVELDLGEAAATDAAIWLPDEFEVVSLEIGESQEWPAAGTKPGGGYYSGRGMITTKTHYRVTPLSGKKLVVRIK